MNNSAGTTACVLVAAYEEFPPDAFTNAERRQGALVLHVMLAMYMFTALAVVCDLYFVSSLDKICEVREITGAVHRIVVYR